MRYQRCRECDEPLSLDEDNFWRDESSPTGFARVCKSCKKTMQYYRVRHPKWMENDRVYPVTGFDEAAERDRLNRLTREINMSIYKKAF